MNTANIITKTLLSFFIFSCLPVFATGSKIIATGGVTQVEGSAGGGIVPWAVIAGYGQEKETNFTFSKTHLPTDDFQFDSTSLAVGIDNTYEFSYAKQSFDLGPLQSILGLPSNQLEQQVFGFKMKLYGDIIYDNSPQLSFGVQYKKMKDFAIPQIAGAEDDEGVDYYLSASRLWLDGWQGLPLMLNFTLRSTNANQLGLMGFGGDLNASRNLLVEVNTSIFLDRNWVLGYEYRQKPDNLSFAKEDDWQDLYLAWFVNKSLATVLAWTDLGSIAGLEKQQGIYLSLQATF